jgi:hypothetical protein
MAHQVHCEDVFFTQVLSLCSRLLSSFEFVDRRPSSHLPSIHASIVVAMRMLRQLPSSWAAGCGGLAVATEADYCRAADQEAAAQPQQHEHGIAAVAAHVPQPADIWPQPDDSGCTPSASAACLHEFMTAQVNDAACIGLACCPCLTLQTG